jgi:hypothetical protein
MRRSTMRFRSAVPLAACLLAIAALALTSCAGQRPSAPPSELRGGRFTLRLVPGPAYKGSAGWFIFQVPTYPQVACWLETAQGGYVDTIYATAKGAKGKWTAAPSGGRPEALPVWYKLREGKGIGTDAVSGPTPSGATLRDSPLASAIERGIYVVKLEVNRSFDYNEAYTRANSGVDGQPSLVYECRIAVGEGDSKAAFRPVGVGNLDGSVRRNLDGLDSALTILGLAEISYEEGAEK